MSELRKWYITFGFAHAHPNCYVVIPAATEREARDKMCAAYGDRWAFSYSEEAFRGQAERYGMREVQLLAEGAIT